MAKCSLCSSRKGKRKCKAVDSLICSLCCGESRSADKCDGCSFYKDSSQNRNYRKVPFYDIARMSDSQDLESVSYVIESTLLGCNYDDEVNLFMDKDASRLLELFFDKYHFKDPEVTFSGDVEKKHFQTLVQNCEEVVSFSADEQLLKVIKVMAAVYRSIQRRTNGNREYMQFIQQYLIARHNA